MRNPAEALGSSTAVQIRAMNRLDIPAISSILEESPETSGWSDESLKGYCGIQTAWTAEQDGRVVGFLIGRTAADEFEILNLAVARSHRRRGIGGQIVKTSLECSWAAGAKRVYLEVRAANSAAIALYQQNGFRICGRRSRYYESPVEDALILSRGVTGML